MDGTNDNSYFSVPCISLEILATRGEAFGSVTSCVSP